MLTINEAAERIPGISRHHIRQMCIRGDVPSIMAGRKYLICEQVLIDYLSQPTQKNLPTPDMVNGIWRVEL